MQTRPYDGKEGSKVWLSKGEQEQLLECVPEDEPRKRIAFQLALNGLRSDEVVDVQPRHVRSINTDRDVLVVPDGKTGKREVPLVNDTAQRIRFMGLNKRDDVVDVSTRTLRTWLSDARERLGEDYADLGMHDLRRTWATDTYYSLAFEGVPIAEQLVMSWGGWKQTSTGRETFRENYLGPVPDHVTSESMQLMEE